MNIWMKKIYLLITTGVIYLIGQYLAGSWITASFCQQYFENGKFYCNSPYLDMGLIFITVGEVLAVTAVLLFFANERGFYTWWRMSRWYLPISIVSIFFFAQTLYLPLSGLVAPESLIWLFGSVYILVTFIIVLWGFFSTSRVPQSLK